MIVFSLHVEKHPFEAPFFNKRYKQAKPVMIDTVIILIKNTNVKKIKYKGNRRKEYAIILMCLEHSLFSFNLLSLKGNLSFYPPKVTAKSERRAGNRPNFLNHSRNSDHCRLRLSNRLFQSVFYAEIKINLLFKS